MDGPNAFKKLLNNSQTNFNETKRILLKIADNIIKNPADKTVRNLPKTNAAVKSKVLSVSGGIDVLKLMGFKESTEAFFLPENEQMDKIISTRNALFILNWSKPNPVEKKPEVEKFQQIKLPPLVKMNFTNPFLQQIESTFHSALMHDNAYLQQRAKKLIPVVEMETKAVQNMRFLQQQIKLKKIPETDVTLQDLLIVELMDWFKNEFFSWVDSPDCEHCGGKTNFLHLSNNPKDFEYTTRVELYKCGICGENTKFPRYNDLNILLETRRGRCGEWANTFTLMCRAMGWDARHVFDEGDHVWTEVYSIGLKRWIHCDPCENAVDTPLMYEIGWKKKITYIMAYSGEELQDVTWRYSCNHKEVLRRRRKCSEAELVDCIMKLRENRQKNFTQARKMYLTKRILSELIEFLTEKKPKEGDNQGRTSGSAAWRLGRGETSEDSLHFWEITDEHLEKNEAIIQYCASTDMYEFHFNNNEIKTLTGWLSGVYSNKNIIRKVEKDWKMVYLCRNEGTDKASVTWEIRIKSTRKILEKIELKFLRTVYENGTIDVQISSGDLTLEIPKEEDSVETEIFEGKDIVKITATLQGGKGNVAWQHAQIFRQSLDSIDYPFVLKLTFKNKM